MFFYYEFRLSIYCLAAGWDCERVTMVTMMSKGAERDGGSLVYCPAHRAWRITTIQCMSSSITLDSRLFYFFSLFIYCPLLLGSISFGIDSLFDDDGRAERTYTGIGGHSGRKYVFILEFSYHLFGRWFSFVFFSSPRKTRAEYRSYGFICVSFSRSFNKIDSMRSIYFSLMFMDVFLYFFSPH